MIYQDIIRLNQIIYSTLIRFVFYQNLYENKYKTNLKPELNNTILLFVI